MSGDTSNMHLADLFERARELGIEGYRLLPRDELVAAIEAAPAPRGRGRGSGRGGDPDEGGRPRRRRRGRRGGAARSDDNGTAREALPRDQARSDQAPGDDAPRDEARGDGPSDLVEQEPAESTESRGSDEQGERPRARSRRGGRGRGGRGRAEGERDGGRGNREEAGTDRGEAAGDGEPRARGRDREPRAADDPRDPPSADDYEDSEDVVGVLDRLPQGHGFLRLTGLSSAEGDVYVSASQIRRCELRPGDEVAGPARQPQRGERHRAMIRVDTVNGHQPETERADFDRLVDKAPSRRLFSDDDQADALVRAVDLLAPVAFGQRVLIHAEPHSGRSTLLRAIGAAVSGKAGLIVVLSDEAPDDLAAWEAAVPEAEIVAAPEGTEPRDQVHAAELAVARAKRRAEAGEDVVVLIDSLSRIALGYRDPSRVKRLFGAGRDLDADGAGSVTVIATVLDDDQAHDALDFIEDTESSVIQLSADLAEAGITPSLIVAGTHAHDEPDLRSSDQLDRADALRADLEELDDHEAAKALAQKLADSATNAELLQ